MSQILCFLQSARIFSNSSGGTILPVGFEGELMMISRVVGVEDSVLAADVDDAFLRGVVRAKLALVPSANRLAQRQDSPRCRVLRVVLLDGANRGLLDVV